MKKEIICITGYPGSGKSVFASAGKEFNLRIFTMGDIVREEAIKKYGEINKHTLGKTAEELRKRFGEHAIAILLSRKLKENKDRIIIVDGVRSPKEIEIFSKIGKPVIIAIIAKKNTRYFRLKKRGRQDDIKIYEDFELREKREKKFGIDEVIENADIYIYNENISLEEFRKISRDIFKKLLDEIYEKEKEY